jgi:uncharacterized membrane protein YhhN
LRAFTIVFALVGLTDLVLLATGHTTWRIYTKPALALILAAGVVVSARGRLGRSRIALTVGLVASAGGDAALLDGSHAAFSTAVACFMLTQGSYIYAFQWAAGGSGLVQRRPWLVLPYAAAWFGTLAFLWPHLGDLRILVGGYGFFLMYRASGALDLVGRIPQRDAVLVATGAVFFMLSDTTLAFARFDPAHAPPQAPLLVMVTYLIAQALIVSGLAGRPVPATPAVRRP